MTIINIKPESDGVLFVVSDDGRTGTFDIKPYLNYEAFEPLRDIKEFTKVSNGGYFIQWPCGADLSADTIEANWQMQAVKPTNQAATTAKSPMIAAEKKHAYGTRKATKP